MNRMQENEQKVKQPWHLSGITSREGVTQLALAELKRATAVYTRKDATNKDRIDAGLKAAAEGWTSFIQCTDKKNRTEVPLL